MAILHTVQLLVGRHLEPDWEDGQRPYSIERHREVRRLTATIRGSLAAAIATERDERGLRGRPSTSWIQALWPSCIIKSRAARW